MDVKVRKAANHLVGVEEEGEASAGEEEEAVVGGEGEGAPGGHGVSGHIARGQVCRHLGVRPFERYEGALWGQTQQHGGYI